MEYFVTASLLNLRSSPALAEGNVLTVLKHQEIVDVMDTSNPSFYKVSCLKRNPVITGYASVSYLKPADNLVLDNIKYLEPVNLNPNASSRRDNHGAWQYPLSELDMPKIDQQASVNERINAMHSIVRYLQVDQSARYKRDVHTYCNIYAYDYCYLTGAFLPRVWWTSKSLIALKAGGTVNPVYNVTVREINANSLFSWLEDWGYDYHWTRTYDLDELQTMVNEGKIGVICAANINPEVSGHICCVIPEKEGYNATRSSGRVVCPLLSQAGGMNFQYYNNNNWWVKSSSRFREYGFWYCSPFVFSI